MDGKGRRNHQTEAGSLGQGSGRAGGGKWRGTEQAESASLGGNQGVGCGWV